MKAIIFDSGPIINLSLNGLLPLIEKLKSVFKGKFLITSQVKQEIYERPVHIPQFELGALRIKDLIDKKILEMPESLDINSKQVDMLTRKFMEEANHAMQVDNHHVQLVSDAEMSCLALSLELKNKGIESIIAVDERTARMLCEKPENLEKIMSMHLHKQVNLVNSLNSFKGFSFVRSSELVYVAYKLGLVPIADPRTLEALILATKFKGSSISWEEINILKKL